MANGTKVSMKGSCEFGRLTRYMFEQFQVAEAKKEERFHKRLDFVNYWLWSIGAGVLVLILFKLIEKIWK